MKAKDINRVINLLEAYHQDLEYWEGCGLEDWVGVTSGTPTPHHKALSDLNESERQEAESFMKHYIADVQQAIDDLKKMVDGVGAVMITGLTPLQFNALQVAIDHFEEHLSDVSIDISEDSVEDLEQKIETLQRLIATKQIKAALREDAA